VPSAPPARAQIEALRQYCESAAANAQLATAAARKVRGQMQRQAPCS
jgi:hypothetical protein